MSDIVPDLKSKNLLVITPHYPNKSGSSYSGIFVKSQIDLIKQYFKEVYVIAPILSSFNYLTEDRLCSNYSYDNVHVYYPRSMYLPWPLYRKSILNKAFYDNRPKVVESLIESEGLEFDLIHAHFTWPSAYVAHKLKEKIGVPTVVTAHGYDIYEMPFTNGFWKQKVEEVLNSADHIITVSRSNLECFSKLQIHSPITLIQNGYDDALFYPQNPVDCRKKLGVPLDKQILLTVGNLTEVKGHSYLIQAMEILKDDNPDLLCFIIGKGMLKSQLESQIRELGLEHQVVLCGGKAHHDIPLWVNACDLFVFPSLRESFGIAQVEAMGCGKPVVATRNGGSEDVITSDKYGYLCIPGNSEELAKNIVQALNGNWDHKEIHAHAENYSWKIVENELKNIYQSLM
jgi:glycosyltransferase involved in cell wall biosynthesis